MPSSCFLGIFEQVRITLSKLVSIRVSNFWDRIIRLKLSDTLCFSGMRMSRGSGENQRIGWPSEYQGKMPEA